MKKLASCFLIVLVGVLALSFPAQADSASRFALKVDRKVLFSGERFTATGTSRTDCDWVLEWNGERRTGDPRRVTATFTAPSVTRLTKIPLKARCFYAAPAPPRSTGPTGVRGGVSQRLTVTVPPSWTKTITITVLPTGSAVSPPGGNGNGTGGVLPNTGGPQHWPLALGLGAVLLGSLVVRRAARQQS